MVRVRGALSLLLIPVVSGSEAYGSDGTCVGDEEQCLLQVQSGRAKPQAAVADDAAPLTCDLPTEECHMGESEKCELCHMSAHAVHAVYPGGNTMCLDSGKPFYFLVKKGDPRKLLITFEEGGACATEETFKLEPTLGPPGQGCYKEPTPGPWAGVMDYANVHNPYHGYSIVRVLYCSGDFYAGAGSQPWGEGGADVHFRGYENTNAALEWSLGQFPHLSNLAVAGITAGAMGLQYWADSLLSRFADRGAATVVHADSFVGILEPRNSLKALQGLVNARWGTCGTAALSPEDQTKCSQGDFTWQGHYAATMGRHKKVLFTSINSKADAEQISANKIYNPTLDASGWYALANLQLQVFAGNSNFRAYFADGDLHSYLRRPEFYTATPLGAEASQGQPTLLKWIASTTTCGPHPPESVCIGEPESVRHDGVEPEGNEYCDDAIFHQR